MAMPLIVGLVAGALALIALVIYANRPQSPSQTAQQAAAQPGSDSYVPMVFGDSSSSSSAADCATDGGAGCGDGGGGGGGD
jgi:hypothetical protein